MFRWIGTLSIATIIVSPVAAETSQGVAVIVPSSKGVPSCGSWTAAHGHPSDGAAFQYEQWVAGFESGLNWARSDARGDVLRNTDREAILGWVDRYCRKHPLDTLVSAVFRLDRELARRGAAR